MVDLIEFFRFFDLGEGRRIQNGQCYFIFSTFRLFDLGEGVEIADCIDVFGLFDFSTRGRV